MNNKSSPQESVHNNLAKRLVKNTLALALGRNINALSRLVVASLVVRSLGVTTFGEYSLIIALLTITEWVLDFGTTDVFVRDSVRKPEYADRLRKILIAVKLLQIPAAILVLTTVLLASQYPSHVVKAGFVAAASLAFMAGVVIYRAAFKASLTMEREIISEFISVVVMVPLVLLVFYFDAGLIGLIIAHLISRITFFAGCYLFGHKDYPLSVSGVTWRDMQSSIKACFVIGMIGFLVVINNAIEIVMLSHLASLSDVAFFSAVQKFSWPLLMVLNAIGTTFFPLMASCWPGARKDFYKTCQNALDTTWILGGVALSCIVFGAEYFIALLGPDLVPAANALRLISIMYVVKATAMVVGPVLYIVEAQRYAFIYFGISLLAKVLCIALVAPIYGYMGVVLVTFAVELLLVTPVTLYFVNRFTGFSINMKIALQVIMLLAGSIFLVQLLVPLGGLAGAVIAPVLFITLAMTTGIMRASDLRSMLAKKV